jgi:4'-phosphopantetheinyl transferase
MSEFSIYFPAPLIIMAQLTPLELQHLDNTSNSEDVLRRLTILLGLKAAYIKAIGQPLGFDWSRLEFDVPGKHAAGDNMPLNGWEFRVFSASLGVLRRLGRRGLVLLDGESGASPDDPNGEGREESAEEKELIKEQYVCCVAFFRGQGESRFDFQTSPEQLEGWVQFINIDQMLKVVPKLTA